MHSGNRRIGTCMHVRTNGPTSDLDTERTPDVAAEAGADAALVIDVQDVHKHFGGPPVLSNLSLRVSPGEIFGLIGPSGSGKTTAIHLLCGHLRPTQGTVLVLGQEPSTFTTAARQTIGYMPQNFILFPDLTVAQNVAFAGGLYGLNEWRHRDRIQAVLDLVELTPARRRTARALSGGMQRRLALAAALVHDPSLLFVDEPTANLDPILRAKLWAHFRTLASHGRTLLVTTQYIDEAEYCDRVGLMYNGTLIAEGRPEALRRQAFGGDLVDIVVDRLPAGGIDMLRQLTTVCDVEEVQTQRLRITVDHAERAIPELLDALQAAGVTVQGISQFRPTFDQVFIRLIAQQGNAPPPVGRLQTSDVDNG